MGLVPEVVPIVGNLYLKGALLLFAHRRRSARALQFLVRKDPSRALSKWPASPASLLRVPRVQWARISPGVTRWRAGGSPPSACSPTLSWSRGACVWGAWQRAAVHDPAPGLGARALDTKRCRCVRCVLRGRWSDPTRFALQIQAAPSVRVAQPGGGPARLALAGAHVALQLSSGSLAVAICPQIEFLDGAFKIDFAKMAGSVRLSLLFYVSERCPAEARLVMSGPRLTKPSSFALCFPSPCVARPAGGALQRPKVSLCRS